MYSFNMKGHRNIIARHRTTIEFTKDKKLGKEGDCVLGLHADFELGKIKDFISRLKSDKIMVEIDIEGCKEIVTGIVNKTFSSKRDIVLRKSNYISERTLMINADKASIDINRAIIRKLVNKRKGRVLIFTD